jgi:hypothetical protein
VELFYMMPEWHFVHRYLPLLFFLPQAHMDKATDRFSMHQDLVTVLAIQIAADDKMSQKCFRVATMWQHSLAARGCLS